MFKTESKPVPPGLTPVLPDVCCGCLGEAETLIPQQVSTVYTQGTSRITEIREYSLPICHSCKGRILGFRKKWGIIGGSLLLAVGALAIAGIPLDRPMLFLIGMGGVVVLTTTFLWLQWQFATLASHSAPLRFRHKDYQVLYKQANPDLTG